MSKAKFEVEKVKWSWAKTVQSPSVYRDDEFVRTKTRDEALAAIDFLMAKPVGLTYTITVLRDDYFTYWRHSMPCLGGLVKYRDSHGEQHFMNPYFPRDIRVAFPDGNIVFIACHGNGNVKTPYNKFILSKESPWVSAFGSKDTIIFKGNYYVLTNMNTDPTVFYSLVRLGGFGYGGSIYGVTPARKLDPKAEILISKTPYADPRRLAGQKPLRISGGTWADGYGYTRPYNESIFKTELPNKFSEFGKLGGYPNAPYTNAYFLKEMKEKFGLDMTKVNVMKVDDKTEETLVKAWDYFKEQAKDLPEYTEKSPKNIIRLDPDKTEKIQKRAKSLWEKDGCPSGKDLHFWLQAEKDIELEEVA